MSVSWQDAQYMIFFNFFFVVLVLCFFRISFFKTYFSLFIFLLFVGFGVWWGGGGGGGGVGGGGKIFSDNSTIIYTPYK